jgi:hemerythrin-like domain-containing protein
MCEYCGCQDIPAIAELTAEHDRLRGLSRDLMDACETCDLDVARGLATEMLRVLGPHTAVEEDGLFPALEAEYGNYVANLQTEHQRVHAALENLFFVAPPASWPADTIAVLDLLFEHILKEQDGLFPAALATLDTKGWDGIIAARRRATALDASLVRSAGPLAR